MLEILRVNNEGVTPPKPLTKEDIEKLLSSGIGSAGRMGGKEIATRVLGEMYAYKCIEEELSIDIVTLFKALKNGIWVKKENNFLDDYDGWLLSFQGDCFVVGHGYDTYAYYFKDYGKTWSLTRKELENETV